MISREKVQEIVEEFHDKCPSLVDIFLIELRHYSNGRTHEYYTLVDIAIVASRCGLLDLEKLLRDMASRGYEEGLDLLQEFGE